MLRNNTYLPIIFTCILLLKYGCNYEVKNETSLPDHVSELENLEIYSPHTSPRDTVELIKEAVFESNEEIYLDGYIKKIAIDDADRVYIGSASMNSGGVYVFAPNGNFLTKISGVGRGPGEFEALGSIDILNNKLYIFDQRLQKKIVFSLKNYEIINEALITTDSATASDSLIHMMRGSNLFVLQNGDAFLELSRWSMRKEFDIDKILFHSVSKNGNVLPGSIVEAKRFPFFFPETSDGIELPFTMPFTRSSLVSITREGTFYVAWTEDFLITVYNKEGDFKRSFHYPIEKESLSINELDIDRNRKSVLDKHELPQTWPALHTMQVDNEDKLWVATITESDSTFQWYVLDQKGEMLARFQMPGRRTFRSAMSDPLIRIHNGYFYIREENHQEGNDRIVKYKINFIPR